MQTTRPSAGSFNFVSSTVYCLTSNSSFPRKNVSEMGHARQPVTITVTANQLNSPTHPPTHPPTQTLPPWGGVGTLGQIVQNQTNPPTHRPQTNPEPPIGVGQPLSKRLVQLEGKIPPKHLLPGPTKAKKAVHQCIRGGEEETRFVTLCPNIDMLDVGEVPSREISPFHISHEVAPPLPWR